MIQQWRVEVNETVSGRMDTLNSITTALQDVSARSTVSKPYRVSDLIPRNWEGSNDKGYFRNFNVGPAFADANVVRAREIRRLEPQSRWDNQAINNVIDLGE